MSWDRPFEDPVVAPDAKSPKTLCDAANTSEIVEGRIRQEILAGGGEVLIRLRKVRGRCFLPAPACLQALRGQNRTVYDSGRPHMPARNGNGDDE